MRKRVLIHFIVDVRMHLSIKAYLGLILHLDKIKNTIMLRKIKECGKIREVIF